MLVTYEIGNDVLKGKCGVTAVRNAMRKEPSCSAEILIAGLTETLETSPTDQVKVANALRILKAAAHELDRRGTAQS